MIKITLSLLIFSLWFHLGVKGQGSANRFSDELLNVVEYYKSQRKFGLAISINTIAFQNGAEMLVSTKKGMVKRDGNLYYYKLDHTEVLGGSNFSIMVNNTYKIIQVKEIDDVDINTSLSDAIIDKTMFENGMCINTEVEEKGDQRNIICDCSNTQIEKLTITINKVDYKLIKVEYQYPADEDGNYVYSRIYYNALDINQPSFGFELDKTNYVQKKENSLIPAAKYKGYEVIDIE